MGEHDTISADAKAIMRFEAAKKSVGIAYLLWFFLGGFGVHRFYAGQTGTGAAILCLTILSMVLTVVGIGVVGLIVVGIWLFVDIFLIPGMIERYNSGLLQEMA